MRKLPLVLVLLGVVAFAGWGGYWFVGSRGAEAAFAGWFDARRADGWVAEYDDLNTAGFPNRFDTTFIGLELADPDNDLAWSAPIFQVLTLSYTPNQFIAVWPHEQVLARPDQRLTITSRDIRGSITFVPDLALPVDHATFELTGTEIASTKGWRSRIGAGQISTRRTPEAEADNTYDLYVTATEMVPGKDYMETLRGVANLPDTIDSVTVSGRATFDAPWDRFAVERRRPQPTRIELDLLTADWGDLNLMVAGTVDVAEDGTPTGEITVKATNWRDMVEIARASGALSDDWAGPVTKALELLATLSGDPETLDIPVRFSRGIMSFGRIPVGAAPKVRLW